MSRFEYVSVLVSIVIALGISEIASAWGGMLRSRTRVRFHWLHAFWSVFSVLLMVQFWWGFWEYRDIETWSFPGLLAVVGECLVLVIAAMVLVPRGEVMESLDLRAHYFAQSRLFFSLGALLLVQLTLIDRLVGGQPFRHPENLFRIPGIAVALVAALSRNEMLHGVLAGAGMTLLVGFLAFTFTR